MAVSILRAGVLLAMGITGSQYNSGAPVPA